MGCGLLTSPNLINEFCRTLPRIKSETGNKIKFDAQAAKDESSLVEQLTWPRLFYPRSHVFDFAAVGFKLGAGDPDGQEK
jgi:hypothetical protein